MKYRSILAVSSLALLSGCFATSKDYQVYAESTSRMIVGANASEAACFLILNEAAKTADNSTKTALAAQIDKCKKPMPKIDPPKKSWFGF